MLGERAAALAELNRALPPLQRLRAHPSVLGCQQELAALGAQLAVAEPAVPPLTGHELSVALLASQGLSNREIGAQLYLSRLTVDYYLRRLYARYGVARVAI
jgi:DNA-binding CsgD family transcriptional regulator